LLGENNNTGRFSIVGYIKKWENPIRPYYYCKIVEHFYEQLPENASFENASVDNRSVY